MKCYIARTFDTDQAILEIVFKALDDLNIKRHDGYDSIPVSNSIKDNIIKSISSADFIIAVVLKQSFNVIFELGVAVGIKKPIFLIMGEDVQTPYNISSFTTIRTNKNLSENLTLPLRQFIESIKKEKKENIEHKIISGSPKSILPNGIFLELNKLRENGTGRDFELFVKQFFDRISNQFTTSSGLHIKDNGYDYALWIDDLEGILINPILFEFKFGNINNQVIENTISKLLHNNNNSSQITFVLYCDKNNKKIGSTISKIPIIFVDIETFIKKVYESNLSTAIIYFRNSAAHGKEF